MRSSGTNGRCAVNLTLGLHRPRARMSHFKTPDALIARS